MKMGLGFRGGKLVYCHKHGFGRWLPESTKHFIVDAWNPIACWLHGHDFLDEGAWGKTKSTVCISCCKEWKQ